MDYTKLRGGLGGGAADTPAIARTRRIYFFDAVEASRPIITGMPDGLDLAGVISESSYQFRGEFVIGTSKSTPLLKS